MYSRPLDVYTQHELEETVYSTRENRNIVLRGEFLETLQNIEKIEGSIAIIAPKVKSLGNLKKVNGNFSISSSAGQPKLPPLARACRPCPRIASPKL